MKSDTLTNNDDPCDVIDVMDLAKWIRYDSSRMRAQNNRKRLGGDSGDRHSNLWVRFDNG